MKSTVPGIATQVYLVTANDTNHHGTIFGGKVMEWADQAGAICARHYCASPVLTASLDRIDFLTPIHVGEEAHITPRMLYAYKTSMQVAIEVKAVDPFRNTQRVTSNLLLTFVAFDPKQLRPTPVPPWKGKEPREAAAFRKKILEQRQGRIHDPDSYSSKPVFHGSKPAKTPDESIVENHFLVMPGDQNTIGFLFAGRYLSWVDICGALSATRHSELPVVTASIEEVHFRERVPKGATVRMCAKPIFASRRSIQIRVSGWVWSEKHEPDRKIADAFLTFVPLPGTKMVRGGVPQLAPKTEQEKKDYLWGQWRYELHRKGRASE